MCRAGHNYWFITVAVKWIQNLCVREGSVTIKMNENQARMREQVCSPSKHEEKTLQRMAPRDSWQWCFSCSMCISKLVGRWLGKGGSDYQSTQATRDVYAAALKNQRDLKVSLQVCPWGRCIKVKCPWAPQSCLRTWPVYLLFMVHSFE